MVLLSYKKLTAIIRLNGNLRSIEVADNLQIYFVQNYYSKAHFISK
jgi:hypothetical protein